MYKRAGLGGGGGGGGNLLHLHAPEVSKHTGLHVHVHVGIKQTEDALDIPIQHSYSFPLHCQGRGREGVGGTLSSLKKALLLVVYLLQLWSPTCTSGAI